MGNTYEVQVWAKDIGGGYSYHNFWSGESFFKAIWNMRKAKKQGFGCVTFHWIGL